MALFLTVFTGTVRLLLSFVEICMLVRAVCSWFPIDDDNPILRFTTMVTEPVIAPVRAFLDRMGWFRNSPIDFSFMIAYLLLVLVGYLLILF